MRFKRLFLLPLLLATAMASETYVQQRTVADLETIRETFHAHYAPLKWKEEYAGWDLDQEIEIAKNKIRNLANPTLKDCQVVIREFFNTAKDYHVGVTFCSTECAYLPFSVKQVEGRYFISYIDKKEIPNYSPFKMGFPFKVGDEILSFDGKPIHEAVLELRETLCGENKESTDFSLASAHLTSRHGGNGSYIPNGSVCITGIKKGTSKEVSANLKWEYEKEQIRDLSQFDLHYSLALDSADRDSFDPQTLFQADKSRHEMALASIFAENPHCINATTSFLPPLGKKVWTLKDSAFDAYIFKTNSGKKIGFIRIPHYSGSSKQAEKFGEIINRFQRQTDALVIDQMNNGGGNLMYMYGLASMLVTKPTTVSKENLKLTQRDVLYEIHRLEFLELFDSNWLVEYFFGKTLFGYPIDYNFIKAMRNYCRAVINEWNSGKTYTQSLYIEGIEKIKPNPTYRYKKPILCLINEQAFSCGDMLPAILQDNKRAVLMGTPTAGAGGCVCAENIPNHSGIKSFRCTFTLVERTNGELIENHGVQPDIPYEITIEDIENDFKPFSEAIVAQIESMVN